MPLFELDGRSPRVHPEAFVAPTATLVGDVTIEAGASVWYGAVLRADYAPVLVKKPLVKKPAGSGSEATDDIDTFPKP